MVSSWITRRERRIGEGRRKRGSRNGCVHIIPSVLLISSEGHPTTAPSFLPASARGLIRRRRCDVFFLSPPDGTADSYQSEWELLGERITEGRREGRALSYWYLTARWDELPLINVFLTARERTEPLFVPALCARRDPSGISLNEKKTFKRARPFIP